MAGRVWRLRLNGDVWRRHGSARGVGVGVGRGGGSDEPGESRRIASRASLETPRVLAHKGYRGLIYAYMRLVCDQEERRRRNSSGKRGDRLHVLLVFLGRGESCSLFPRPLYTLLTFSVLLLNATALTLP